MHEQILCERDGADTLILFIHGILGSPGQFAPWLEACYAQGYSVASILLPGHGVDGRGFGRSTLADWERHVRERLRHFGERYPKVVVVGHSMGGLLALNETVLPGNVIRGVFMIAAPIKLNFAPWSIANRLALVLSPGKRSIWQEYQRGYGIVGRTPMYVYPSWVRPFWSLKRLIEKAKRNMGAVHVPMFVVHSGGDEAVSVKSADSLMRGLCGIRPEHMRLEDSWHACYTEAEARKVTEQLLPFIRLAAGQDSSQ